MVSTHMAESMKVEEEVKVLSLHVIWLDAQGLDSADNRKTHLEFAKNFGRCCLKKNGTDCMEIVEKSYDGIKFVLIVSGQIGQDFIPKIRDNSKFSSVYVFCGNIEFHKSWSEGIEKVKLVTNNLKELILKIRADHSSS